MFASDADDSAIRALVSETPGAAFEANDARKHADAMARHRQHVVDTIQRAGAQAGRAARQAHEQTLIAPGRSVRPVCLNVVDRDQMIVP